VLHSFLIALQFLTRLPLFFSPDYQLQYRINAILFYPLIGFMIGGLLLMAALLLDGVEPLLSAAVILTLWVLITGGLHLDGLADSADAWAGGFADVQRSLDIMQDPRSGPIEVVILLLHLLLKFSAIFVLLKNQQAYLLLFAPIYGRAAAALLLITTPYARKNGLGSEMAEQASTISVSSVLIFTIFILLLFLNVPQWAFLLLMFFISFYWLRRLMMHRLNGMTGDTAGAMIELVELFILLTLTLT